MAHQAGPYSSKVTISLEARCSSSPVVRYGVPLIAGAIALTLAISIPSELPLKLPLLQLYATLIIASAWLGGFWPGLIATVFCTVGASYWLEPRGLLLQIHHSVDVVALVLLFLIGAALSALGENARKAVRYERTSRELAEKVAEAERSAAQAREDMLSMVAHDLRDPLGVIDLNAALISRASTAEGNAEISRRAALVHRTAQRMEGIIRNLLDVARIDAGGFSLDMATEPVEPLLAEVVEAHVDHAKVRNIQLQHDVPAGTPHILCDRARIHQVLTNLVINAMKFTSTGGKVALRAGVSGRFVRFSVTDTGVGIDGDKLPRIFQRYFGEERTRGGGIGLGLFISKSIVEAHHGTIEADSRVGHGSTFSFTVPIIAQASATEPTTTSASGSGNG